MKNSLVGRNLDQIQPPEGCHPSIIYWGEEWYTKSAEREKERGKKKRNHKIASQPKVLPPVEKHSSHPVTIALTHSCSSHPDNYHTVASAVTSGLHMCHQPSCCRDPEQQCADRTWLIHFISFFLFSRIVSPQRHIHPTPHLARFSGHNFPLGRFPYWRLGLSRHSRVRPSGPVIGASTIIRPRVVWPAQTAIASTSPSPVRRRALPQCRNGAAYGRKRKGEKKKLQQAAAACSCAVDRWRLSRRISAVALNTEVTNSGPRAKFGL